MPDEPARPLAFFISFHTYGTWLHGQHYTSVDSDHNEWETPTIPHAPALAAHERSLMDQDPFTLTQAQRAVVDQTIREVCEHRHWQLFALNVRTNHVHAVADGADTPEKMMGDFKRWATRRLRECRLVAPDCKIWVVHGSTRWIWTNEKLAEKIDYTLNQQ